MEPPPPPSSSHSKQGLTIWQIVGRTAAILIAISVTLAIFYFIPDIERFKQYGYLGVFIISFISNATIALPVPGLAITFAMAAVLPWPLVGLVAGVGEALGETTGYLAGFGGRAVIENREMYDRLHYWMERRGLATIFVLAAIPNPLFDLAGVTAGILKYPYYKFLFAAWLGKTLKALILAWAGANSITWLLQFFG